MTECRRGMASERKNDLWHWRFECPSFPRNAYEVRSIRPSDDYLCSRCSGIEGDAKARSAV